MEVKLIRDQNSKVVRRISNLVGMYFEFFKQDVTVAKIRQISDRDIIVVHKERRDLCFSCAAPSLKNGSSGELKDDSAGKTSHALPQYHDSSHNTHMAVQSSPYDSAQRIACALLISPITEYTCVAQTCIKTKHHTLKGHINRKIRNHLYFVIAQTFSQQFCYKSYLECNSYSSVGRKNRSSCLLVFLFVSK